VLDDTTNPDPESETVEENVMAAVTVNVAVWTETGTLNVVVAATDTVDCS
jgi:hypothetical protein